MTLNFALIPGINRIDTPYFASLQEQDDWFADRILVSINSAYYPPHYYNRIRVSEDEINATTSINYCWFVFNSRTYYYFITNITYINEGLFELSIELDEIQTYMFDIRIKSGIIERKFINRWYRNSSNVWCINRNYIRENVSSKLYEKLDKNYITSGESVVVLKSTKSLTELDVSTPDAFKRPFADSLVTFINTEKTDPNNNNMVVSPYHYTLVFDDYSLNGLIYNDVIYNAHGGVLYSLIRKTETCDGYLVPIEYFSGMFVINNRTITLYPKHNNEPKMVVVRALDSYAFEWGRHPLLGESYLGDINDINDYDISYTIVNPLSFSRNVNTGVLFSSGYLPILFDENYTYIRYGNNDTYIDVPLHYYEIVNFNVYAHLDISTGTCTYGVYSKDNYLSCYEIDTNIMSIELLNNAWNDYVANNKNRWATAGLKAGVSAVESFVSIATGSLFAAKGMDRVLKDARSYTKKRHNLKVGAQRHLARMKDDIAQSNIEDLTSGAMGIATPLIGQAIEDNNNQQKPDSPKQTGNIVSLLAQNKRLYWQLFKCRDYEQCAKYFHRNGYHVEEFINTENNIFTYVQNRYYFNVLKMSDVNLYLQGRITDTDTIEGITERLFTGLRLWNVNNTGVDMGDFTYDNVELDFI